MKNSPLLVCAAFAAVSSSSAFAQYTQLFPNASTTTNAPVSSISWTAYQGSTATNVSGAVAGSPLDRVGIASANGVDGTAGFLFAANNTGTATDYAVVTAVTAFRPDGISWRMGNSATNVGVRVLVQVGGSWYATSQLFTNASTYTASTFAASIDADTTKSFTFSTAGANWRAVTLTPGTALSVGASALASPLASDSITGIGFFIDGQGGQAARIDNLVVTAIPEPSSFAALCGFGAVCAAALRRRRA